MTGGTLEVLLVDAEGIRHTNLLGKPIPTSYYVIIECGTRDYRSKESSSEDDKISWNEKFTFEFPLSDWKNLTHLKFRIMDTELFRDAGFVGETIVHLGGIITEGKDRGFIELKPAPYNVVLEDDTYKGEIKIGFRFITNYKR
ncbi:PREDICTED: elicitor-responsive protein 3 [Prunus mume]|uniref:Elicitor-responsive protein 3 n=1 Tax=Prunus mume TaxID=102107 RepID=A0ABM1LQT4_PRUMU|nr:PREDICTED: elicitor-responsive protein 3 [Prunus mume]